MFLLLSFKLLCVPVLVLLSFVPAVGAANTEIKVPSAELTKVLSFRTDGGQNIACVPLDHSSLLLLVSFSFSANPPQP